MPKPRRGTVDDIVKREIPGAVVRKPSLGDARQQRARPDARVPSLDAMRQKAIGRGPGANASRSASSQLRRERDTEVRAIEQKDAHTDDARAVGPKAVIVSRSKGKIVSRQG